MKIPVLDNGFVELIDSCMTTRKLREIGWSYYTDSKTKNAIVAEHGQEIPNPPSYPVELEKAGFLVLGIKCPLFFQLFLSFYNIKIVNADINKDLSKVEAYRPNFTEIGCSLLEDSQVIADDINRTTDALLINPLAYQADGAEKFVSQVIMPVSVYTTIIAYGEYDSWAELIKRIYDKNKQTPAQIMQYLQAIEQIIKAEWS